jgi:hypothetical protein
VAQNEGVSRDAEPVDRDVSQQEAGDGQDRDPENLHFSPFMTGKKSVATVTR